MAQVLRAGVPRALWVSGFVLAAGGGALCLVLGRLEPLVLVAIGLTLAAFPLFARADAVEIDGPHVRVRRLIWWRGPVDLRQLVALVYRPMTPRSPAAWMLIQRQAGPPLRWYWRLVIGRET